MITLSDSAVGRLRQLLAAEEEKGLRIKVVGGGCSGLQYKLDMDSRRPGDRVFERDGVRVLTDRKSYLYLRGTEVDYVEDLMQATFRLNNPNVKASCGCGSSFSV